MSSLVERRRAARMAFVQGRACLVVVGLTRHFSVTCRAGTNQAKAFQREKSMVVAFRAVPG